VKKNNLLFILFLFSFFSLSAQTEEISGQVTSTDKDLEGIHVINKTSRKFATTDSIGKFKIKVKLKDTVVFSSIIHQLKAVVITENHLKEKAITVELLPQINELDEVVVGKILTGDISSDIGNSEAKRPIDFYDVGIPGYTGKPKTQSERRLYDADHGKMFAVGLGAAVNVNKLLNAISGRTKKLKKRVKLEADEALLYSIKARLGKDFFKENPLTEDLQMDFLFFCSEDENFSEQCSKNDIATLEYLKTKYDQILC